MQGPLTLEVLFRILPLRPELLGLRESMMSLSAADATRQWSGSAGYTTLDGRVLGKDALDTLLDAAELRSVERARSLHRALRESIGALSAGQPADALSGLAALGEAAMQDARWEDCLAYYALVENVARELGDLAHTILAARRLGRSHLHLGDNAAATQCYARSLAAAEAAADREGRVIALTGLGHVATMEGRWSDAELRYHAALLLNGDAGPQLRGQLEISLSVAAREQARLDDAERWIASALEVWDALSEADRSTWWNSSGMLLMERAQYAEADQLFQRALAAAPSHFDSAMILDNMADLALRRGSLHDAETWARKAEGFAIAGAAPRALAEVYIRLGSIMRMRDDPNGVGFFEKALELARDFAYPFTEALACAEYALFRREAGDLDEAAGLRSAALDIFARLGTDPLPAAVRDLHTEGDDRHR
ncbi:MAG: tetratricopeptide repeat protein [Gemmatimonadota bacterium]